MRKVSSITAALAAVLLTSVAAQAGDVRIMWYSDGVEGEVIKDLLSRFSKDNPGINVILDEVSYDVVREQLPVQLEAGKGPDIARVTNLKAPAQHWLDLRPHVADAAYWDENFGAQADWMRPDGSNAITGFMTQITVTGGFANKTLFDQAGVAIPGRKRPGTTGRRQPNRSLKARRSLPWRWTGPDTVSRGRISPSAPTTSLLMAARLRLIRAQRISSAASSNGMKKA